MCGPTGMDTGSEGLCATCQRPQRALIIEEVLGDQAEGPLSCVSSQLLSLISSALAQ